MIKDTSCKNICFHKQGLKYISKRPMQLWSLEFLKKVGWIFKGKSTKASKYWPRFGLLGLILKSPIRINFSHLLDSLLLYVISGCLYQCILLVTDAMVWKSNNFEHHKYQSKTYLTKNLFFSKFTYRISSKRRASNKRRPLISAAPLGIHIEISASL